MVAVWLGLVLAAVLLVLGVWLVARSGEATGSKDTPPGRPHPTREGTWVASKGEQRIANWLHARSIEHAYEPEVAGGLTPDFHLVGTDVLIEYWGMTGQPGYEDRMEEKMQVYEEHGFDVVGLFPTHLHEMEDVLERELAKRGIVADRR